MKSALRFFVTLFLVFISNTSFAYWQQEVNYKIEVALNDQKHELNGFIEIEYINNSPDTLNFLLIHLWPNAYKNEETALGQQLLVVDKTNFHWSEKKDRGFIDSLDFKINQQNAKWSYYNKQIDIAKIELGQALLPGQKTTITTPFRVKIPLGTFSRLGHISQSYQITQWYPKPAVYDAQGWHPLNYLNQGEFYSEYGSFNVKITLPENYVVGATGDLQGESGEKELQWLQYKVKQTEEKIKKAKDGRWAKIFDKENDTIRTASSSRVKTLEYAQHNIHDFAWFANKEWNVLKGEVLLPQSQRKVTTWAMFTDAESYLWQKSLTYLHDATYNYSLWNGEYPYNHVTAVDGSLSAGSGMEYPNITVIGESDSDLSLEEVIMHEVGHNWFYGILGSNERRNAWMDEGINSFNEMRYLKQKYPKAYASSLLFGPIHGLLGKNDPPLFDLYYINYIHAALKGEDQKLDLTSADFSNDNYGAIVYSKSAAIFNYLFNYLGQEKFDYCMKMYFNQWKFKHPQPKDLEQIFTENCKEDLSWFFNDLLKTDKVVDYQIINSGLVNETTTYNDTKKSISVLVKNTGEIESPVSISCFQNDSLVLHEWFSGFKGTEVLCFNSNVDFNKIVIDAEHSMPEINRSNNTLNSGIFPRMEPIKLSPVLSMENPKYNNVYFLPTVGFNEYDRFMLGMAFHNYQFPMKNTRFWINPTYSFKNKIMNGDAHLRYFIRKPLPFLSGMEAGVALKQYSINEYAGVSAQFQKIEPSIRFIFKKKDANSPYSTELVTRMVRLNKEMIAGLGDNKYEVRNNWKNYYEAKFIITKKAATNSFVLTPLWQLGPDFQKITITGDFRFKLNKQGNELKVRIFGGKFLDQAYLPTQQFTLRGHRDEDYLYDNVLIGRGVYNSIYMSSQQIYTADGGFKFGLYGNDIRGKNWMAAINFTYDLPIPAGPNGPSKPTYLFALFADLGTSDGVLNNGASFYYDSGIQLTLLKDVIEIYFPIFMSDQLKNSYETSAFSFNYFQKIRFLLNFNNMNLLKKLKDL
ncbi:MAG: M1 family metallopeptidase [Bacteroidetes bacterium]|nr:M1 family metallopeptidase [Bacteroidota bacterium]